MENIDKKIGDGNGQKSIDEKTQLVKVSQSDTEEYQLDINGKVLYGKLSWLLFILAFTGLCGGISFKRSP